MKENTTAQFEEVVLEEVEIQEMEEVIAPAILIGK